eukprot:scaffold228771_cov51-Attheya_sp.AAC.1
MVCMLFPDIFNTKVINDETKCDWTGFVSEETGGTRHLDVSGLGEMFAQAFVGKDSGLGQSIHTLLDLDHDVPVMYQPVQ